ncbi:beta-galactosidase domain 3-containing protein [Streptomyces sp. NPDC127074]|uniref:beta-galactosidase domain 3-containing protein n=1 Tax=Streptomyces sp. NPDC127074 TaxID=3347130 RepID=UPI003650DB51
MLAAGPELLRTADYDNGVLRLTGDTDRAARLRVLTSASANSVTSATSARLVSRPLHDHRRGDVGAAERLSRQSGLLPRLARWPLPGQQPRG